MKINLRKIVTAALACILSLSSAAAAVSVYNGSGDIFSKVSAAQQGHITIPEITAMCSHLQERSLMCIRSLML